MCCAQCPIGHLKFRHLLIGGLSRRDNIQSGTWLSPVSSSSFSIVHWASDAFCIIVMCNTHPVLFYKSGSALSSCQVTYLWDWVAHLNVLRVFTWSIKAQAAEATRSQARLSGNPPDRLFVPPNLHREIVSVCLHARM